MSDRERQKRGIHATISGDAADEVIDTLVGQFSDPYAFVRELIQNSLDGGASRIEVEMSLKGRDLAIAVRDDGEGMDRATIEGCLLVKFRSAKSDDLTKIGKFGIGFVSLWALSPHRVVVDTGRDGVWHRVVFDEQRNYTLLKMPDPFEGTVVTLWVASPSDIEAGWVCERVRGSAVKWCRFANADITTAATGIPDPWKPASIRAPFAVDSPIRVEESGDGWHAVLGVHPSPRPPIGFYNRGLTLWEAEEGLLPGVTFRVEGRHLGHTLTRDNVLRDRHFTVVLDRLRRACETRLADSLHQALAEAASAGDLERVSTLFASVSPEVCWTWKRNVPLLPAIGRTPLCLDEIDGILPRLWAAISGPRVLYCSMPGQPLGERVAAAGHCVLAGAHTDPHLTWLSSTFDVRIVPVEEEWFALDLHRPEGGLAELVTLAASMLRAMGERGDVVTARLAGTALVGEPCVRHPGAGALIRRNDIGSGALVLNLDHPLLEALAGLPVPIAAAMWAHAVRVWDRGGNDDPEILVDRALEALARSGPRGAEPRDAQPPGAEP